MLKRGGGNLTPLKRKKEALIREGGIFEKGVLRRIFSIFI